MFLTCYTGYGVDRRQIGSPEDLRRVLVCVDRTSGKILWQQAAKAKLPEDPAQGFLADHGYASSTPASDGERVYVFYGKSGALAYDLDGKLLWQTDLGDGSAPMGWGSGASPLVYKDVVIFNAGAESQALVALDGKTGKQVWKAAADGMNGSWSTPVLVDDERGGQELVIAVPEEIWGLNPDTGKLLWYAESVSSPAQCSSLVAHDNVVFEVSGRSNSATAILRRRKRGCLQEPYFVAGQRRLLRNVARLSRRLFVLRERSGRGRLRRRRERRSGVQATIARFGAILWFADRSRRSLVRGQPVRRRLRAGRRAAVQAAFAQRTGRRKLLQRQPRGQRQAAAVAFQ